MVLYFIGLVIR